MVRSIQYPKGRVLVARGSGGKMTNLGLLASVARGAGWRGSILTTPSQFSQACLLPENQLHLGHAFEVRPSAPLYRLP